MRSNLSAIWRGRCSGSAPHCAVSDQAAAAACRGVSSRFEGGIAQCRKVLDEQRPKYHLARQVFRERSQLTQPLAIQALAVPPGQRRLLSRSAVSVQVQECL